MRIQMNGRVPAAGHAQRIAADLAFAAIGLVAHHLAHGDGTDAQTAFGLHRHVAAQDLNTSVMCFLHQAAHHRLASAHVHHGDLRTGLLEQQGIGVSAVVVGEEHDALAHAHAVQLRVVGHGRGQHDTGQIVVAKHHGALMGARGQNHLVGTNAPHALPEALAVLDGLVVGQRLTDGQEVVVMATKHHTPADDAHIGHAGELSLGALDPVAGGLAVYLALQTVGCTAQVRTEFSQDDACATAPAHQRGGQTGHAATGN